MTKYFDVCSLLTQDIDRIMLLHGARVMESVKPILDSETRTEDVKEQVKHNAASLLLPVDSGLRKKLNWFLREMMPEQRVQKFHTDNASLPASGSCFWLSHSVKQISLAARPIRTTTKICASSTEVIHGEISGCRREMWAFFSGYSKILIFFYLCPLLLALTRSVYFHIQVLQTD